MKSLSIASLTLLLALTGCSSSPSIEQEMELKLKVIEYESCLRIEEEYWKDKFDDPQRVAQTALGNCASKRP